ncbi:MAG: metallophosphoesterase family protein [Acidobacteriota bacterium]
MRLAVISDIHANLEALREVLRDIEAVGADRVVSLGDNIGYGPEPQAVVELMKELGIPSVMGNHELALVNPRYGARFNPSARLSLEITRGLLSEESLASLFALKHSMVSGECLCVHGFPPHSAVTYLFEVSDETLRKNLTTMKQDICFVGHTHELGLATVDGSHLDRKNLSQGPIRLKEGIRHLVNVGSVGQPRDGDNRAKYVLWNDESRILDVRFVPYDIERTARKIIELGFPSINATRLR